GNTEITKRENIQDRRNQSIKAAARPKVIESSEIGRGFCAYAGTESQRREEVTLTHSPASQSQLRTERQRCAGGRLFRLREPDRGRRAFLRVPSQRQPLPPRNAPEVHGRIRWPMLGWSA